MDANDLKGLFTEATKRMDTSLEHVKHELGGVRTGRASVTILDSVHVDAYGSKMPLNQLAGLSVPEPTLIVAQPFDPSLLGAIEKAIRASDLGLNPANDGKVVRSPFRRSPRSAARSSRATFTSWPRKAATPFAPCDATRTNG
jgi:ribosome recycling factor